MIRVMPNTVMSTELIQKILLKHRGEVLPRLEKLEKYYCGDQAINGRVMKDSTKPNNKVVNPYANYITDMFVGYFSGEPITYTSQDEGALEQVQLTFEYNDEQDENSELCKDASVYGVAYEMLYVDKDGMVRFKKVSPKETVCVYDNTVENELLYVLRYYENEDLLTDTKSYTIEVYSANDISYYISDYTLGGITLVEQVPHFFGLVPFSRYSNNETEIGDYELVIDLIDAYDKLVSDSINAFEYFNDAYLALYGASIDEEEARMMKEQRILMLDVDAKAEWLIKSATDSETENAKVRLSEDIHKFSKCPALTDKDFASNASGVAMKFKVMGMENVAATKERKFKKGLQRRLELISNIFALTRSAFDWRGISITFTRNLPANTVEIAEMISKLSGMVSTETLLAQLPFIDDAVEEYAKLKEEKELNTVSFLEGGLVDERDGEDSESDLRE